MLSVFHEAGAVLSPRAINKPPNCMTTIARSPVPMLGFDPCKVGHDAGERQNNKHTKKHAGFSKSVPELLRR